MVLPFHNDGTRPCSQRHSFEHQARHSPTSSLSSRAAFQNEIATGKRCGTALRLDGRVLSRARANGVQDVELVRRANGDRTLCERVEKIRVVVKLEVASRRDHESHARDHRIANRHVIRNIGPV